MTNKMKLENNHHLPRFQRGSIKLQKSSKKIYFKLRMSI